MRRAVVVVLDGMRRDLINDETTPTLARFAARAQSFAVHRSMFPSATRVVSASFATGCTPARHELQGNSLALMENGRLVYHDIYGAWWVTKFCYRYEGDGGFVPHGDYNNEEGPFEKQPT